MTNTQVNIDELKSCFSDRTIDCDDLLSSAEVKNYLADTSTQAFNIEELRKQEKEKKQAYELADKHYIAAKEAETKATAYYESKQAAESNQLHKAKYAVGSNSEWYYIDDLSRLKNEQNNTKRGHVEHNYSDVRNGVSKCTYGSSPQIHTKCERELKHKISEFENYERYKNDTRRAYNDLQQKKKDYISATEAKNNAETEYFKIQEDIEKAELNILYEQYSSYVEEQEINAFGDAMEAMLEADDIVLDVNAAGEYNTEL